MAWFIKRVTEALSAGQSLRRLKFIGKCGDLRQSMRVLYLDPGVYSSGTF